MKKIISNIAYFFEKYFYAVYIIILMILSVGLILAMLKCASEIKGTGLKNILEEYWEGS